VKSFFSRATMATVFGLLTGIGLSFLSFNPEALAQFPNPVNEAKKRAKEEEKRLKEEEEKRLKEAEARAKEEENKLKEEEEKRLKETETKLKEEKRLKEEEEKRLREEEKRLKVEKEASIKEEEKRLKEEKEARLREEEAQLKEEENRLKEEKNRLKEEKRLEEEETRLKEKEEADRLREERERRKKEAKNGNSAPAGAPVRAEGLDVAILMLDSRGAFSPVDPSREFVNGDQFRVEYNSRLNGIVYLVNVDPKGVATVIYRDEVSYGKKYVHPAPEENQVIQFRGSAGIEVLKIIISTKEIPDLEIALRESGGKMGTNMRQARDELLGYVAPKQEPGKPCSGLELSDGGAKSSCRDLSVVSMKQEQGKISVAVNPKSGGAGPNSFDSARLNNGEMAVLEIRLKHVQR
jgi:hypothetical protein